MLFTEWGETETQKRSSSDISLHLYGPLPINAAIIIFIEHHWALKLPTSLSDPPRGFSSRNQINSKFPIKRNRNWYNLINIDSLPSLKSPQPPTDCRTSLRRIRRPKKNQKRKINKARKRRFSRWKNFWGSFWKISETCFRLWGGWGLCKRH